MTRKTVKKLLKRVSQRLSKKVLKVKRERISQLRRRFCTSRRAIITRECHTPASSR